MRFTTNVELDPVPWQQPSETAGRERWDVLVVGAGPAGSVAALHLARQGHRVLLLDQKRFPRDKPCGDGLLADAQRVLQRAGLLEQAQKLGNRLTTLEMVSPSGIECRVPGQFLTLKRSLLDALLARAAVDAGAVFCQGQVEELVEDGPAGVTGWLAGSSQVCRARVGVIATGASVGLLRKLGLVTHRQASGAAFRCYVRSSLEVSHLVIAYDRASLPGYSWIFPMGGQEYNVGCGMFYRHGRPSRVNLREMIEHFIRGFPLARELLGQGEIISSLGGAPIRCGLKGVSAVGDGRVVAIGETLGTTYPSTAEGVGKAMETGELAAEVIHNALKSADNGRMHEFAARLERRWRRRYQGYETAARWLSHPWLNDFLAWRTRQSPFFRDLVSGIVCDSVNPRTILSLSVILKSFWC